MQFIWYTDMHQIVFSLHVPEILSSTLAKLFKSTTCFHDSGMLTTAPWPDPKLAQPSWTVQSCRNKIGNNIRKLASRDIAWFIPALRCYNHIPIWGIWVFDNYEMFLGHHGRKHHSASSFLHKPSATFTFYFSWSRHDRDENKAWGQHGQSRFKLSMNKTALVSMQLVYIPNCQHTIINYYNHTKFCACSQNIYVLLCSVI